MGEYNIFGRTALGGNIFWSATLSVVPAHGTKVVIVKPPEGLPTLVSQPIIRPSDTKQDDVSVTEVRFSPETQPLYRSKHFQRSEIYRPHISSPFSLGFPTHVATMWHPFSESKCTIFFAIHRSRRPTSSLSAPLPHHRPSTETYQQRSVSAVAPAAIRITGRG